MNEFVVILKSINLKMANWKFKIKKIFKSNGYKTISHSRCNLFSSSPKKQS